MLARIPVYAATLAVPPDAARLVASWLSGRSTETIRAYRQDLESFAAFVGAEDVDAAARELLGRGQGGANALALDWRNGMADAGRSSATVNRRLAALRSLVTLGRTLGMVGWTLEVPNLRGAPMRDTRGPGTKGVAGMLEALRSRSDMKGVRDRAILRLLYDLALRRGEVVSLDVADVDLSSPIPSVAIKGKGRTGKEPRTLAPQTAAALRAYLAARGMEPGPLFVNVDRAGKGRRLTGRSVAYVIGRLGAEVGIKARPHGLRHAAITRALELLQGDVAKARRFSRHAKVETLMVYDDRRSDSAGETARALASEIPE